MRLTRCLPGLALFALATWQAPIALADEPVCQSHGTAVDFVASPEEAARFALKKEKLVFVLHVSGLFEDAAFT